MIFPRQIMPLKGDPAHSLTLWQGNDIEYINETVTYFSKQEDKLRVRCDY